MKKVNLILDMDGVLIDSIEVQKRAFYGSYMSVVGDSNCPDFSEFLKHTGDSLENIFIKMNLPLKMIEVFRKISMESIDKIIFNKQLISLIDELKSMGSKISICTGKDHERAVEILKYAKIEKKFDVLVASDDVDEPKPSAKPALFAIEKMKVSRESCVFVGDGQNDVLCARNAGIPIILALWYGDTGNSETADYVAYKVSDLRHFLLRSILEN